jgi:hypothetical protein
MCHVARLNFWTRIYVKINFIHVFLARFSRSLWVVMCAPNMKCCSFFVSTLCKANSGESVLPTFISRTVPELFANYWDFFHHFLILFFPSFSSDPPSSIIFSSYPFPPSSSYTPSSIIISSYPFPPSTSYTPSSIMFSSYPFLPSTSSTPSSIIF